MYQDGKASPARARERWLHGAGGFTLVEVVIAIAVTSFVLISILGMMAYATRVVHQSDNNARLSAVTGQVLTVLGNQSFYTSRNEASTNFAFYFTSEGLPTNSAGAYYQCAVTNITPSGFALKDVFGSQLMEPVRVTLRWPAPAYVNTNFIITSIANYD
jgi:type II secretory pathway pseudopilin PulG